MNVGKMNIKSIFTHCLKRLRKNKKVKLYNQTYDLSVFINNLTTVSATATLNVVLV